MRVFTFFSLPTHGHVFPLLPIAKRLVSGGDRVIFYGREDYRSLIGRSGAEFRPLPYSFEGFNAKPVARSHGFREQILDYAWEHIPQILAGRAHKEPLHLFHTVIQSPRPAADILLAVQRCLPELVRDLKEIRPDCIVEDSMSPFGRYLRGPTSAPTVVIWSSPNYSRMLWWPRPMLDTLLRHRDPERYDAFLSLAGELGRQYGMTRLSVDELFFRNHGDMNIALVPERWQPDRGRFGDDCRWAGFAVAANQIPDDDFPLDRLEQGRTIFISIGTVFNHDPSFYKRCMRALAGTPYTVVMAIGDKLSLAELEPIPANFIVRPFVPQGKVLARTSLFVTHGTTNNTAEILEYKTPAIFCPQAYDQFLTSSIAVENGLGVPMDKGFAPADLAAGIEHVMANRPSFLASIHQAREGSLDGLSNAVGHIGELLRGKARRRRSMSPDRAVAP